VNAQGVVCLSDESSVQISNLNQMAELNLLYHPHFEPSLTTLRRALLVSDSVRSIVPKSAAFRPSIAVFKHMETLPGTFIPTPPAKDDVNIVSDYYVLTALEKAFSQLSKDSTSKKLKGKLSHGRNSWSEKLSIDGVTLLNAAKVAYVVRQQLQDHQLIFEERDDGNFLVDERAAALILSYLAQRMSRRLAVRTLAGIADSYLLSTACDVYDGLEANKNAVFASAILRMHVPGEIREMDYQSYSELRDRYADLRQSFPIYLQQLQQLYSIEDVESADAMRSALHDIERRLGKDMERIRSSKIGGTIRRWAPLCLGNILSVGAALIPAYTATLTLGAIAIQTVGSALDKAPMRGQFDGVRSMMMSARSDILRANRLSKFLGGEMLKIIE
jgi:hypothetical protein